MRDDKSQRTVDDGDKKMDMYMGVLAINQEDFYGELLVVSFTVEAATLTAFDIITNWATFPDPWAPGKMHAMSCVTDFNEWTGLAH